MSTYTLLRLWMVVAGLYLVGLDVARGVLQSVPQQITFSLTVRDFLPLICMNRTEINALWPPVTIKLKDIRVKTVNADCRALVPKLVSGAVRGHPDFEIGSDLNTLPNVDALTTQKYEFSHLWFLPGTSGFHNPRQTTILEAEKNSPANISYSKISRIVLDYLDYSDPSGIPKPLYALNCENDRCGVAEPDLNYYEPARANITLLSTSGSQYFKSWYQDDAKYNNRNGFQYNLTIVNEAQAKLGLEPPKYVFDSANFGGFFPLNELNGTSKIWPYIPEVQSYSPSPTTNRFWFTTELHSFFQYSGKEEFFFSGDDDVWVFVNGKLAVDLGGLHVPLSSGIILKDHESFFGLEVGKIYSFDMFHAERHMSLSNFKVTTNIVQSCNVLRSGSNRLDWTAIDSIDSLKLVGGSTWGIVENAPNTPGKKAAVLVRYGKLSTTGYIWLKQAQNIGPGFVTEFVFSVDTQNSPGGEGFAFVFHRSSNGITNMNGGSGANLGIRNIQNSVAVVFDLCADRSSSCAEQEVRIHVSPVGNEEGNINSISTRKVYSKLPFSLKDNALHTVKIEYLSSPPWIQVYVDNSLFLQLRDSDLEKIIGGREAYLGFTASTGSFIDKTSTIRIHAWKVATVDFDVQGTDVLKFENKNLIGNGRDELQITIQTRDVCRNALSVGGKASLGGGFLLPRSSTFRRRTQEQEEEETTPCLNSIIRVDARDNQNGTYNIPFTSSVEGIFVMFVQFGKNCTLNETMCEILMNTTSVGNRTDFSDENCWRTRMGSLTVLPAPTLEPTLPPAKPLFTQDLVLGLAIGGASVCLLGSLCAICLCRSRSRWRKEKKFVEAGRLATLERDIRPTQRDVELTTVANKVQLTLEEMNRYKAASWGNNKQDELDIVKEQTEEIKKTVQDLRKRKMQDDDVYYPKENASSNSSSSARPRLDMKSGKRTFAPMQASRAMFGEEEEEEEDRVETDVEQVERIAKELQQQKHENPMEVSIELESPRNNMNKPISFLRTKPAPPERPKSIGLSHTRSNDFDDEATADLRVSLRMGAEELARPPPPPPLSSTLSYQPPPIVPRTPTNSIPLMTPSIQNRESTPPPPPLPGSRSSRSKRQKDDFEE